MKEKKVTLPDPDHPISIQRNAARVVVSAAARANLDGQGEVVQRELLHIEAKRR